MWLLARGFYGFANTTRCRKRGWVAVDRSVLRAWNPFHLRGAGLDEVVYEIPLPTYEPVIAAHAVVSTGPVVAARPYCDDDPADPAPSYDLFSFNRVDSRFDGINYDGDGFIFTVIPGPDTAAGNENSPNGLAFDDSSDLLYFSSSKHAG